MLHLKSKWPPYTPIFLLLVQDGTLCLLLALYSIIHSHNMVWVISALDLFCSDGNNIDSGWYDTNILITFSRSKHLKMTLFSLQPSPICSISFCKTWKTTTYTDLQIASLTIYFSEHAPFIWILVSSLFPEWNGLTSVCTLQHTLLAASHLTSAGRKCDSLPRINPWETWHRTVLLCFLSDTVKSVL